MLKRILVGLLLLVILASCAPAAESAVEPLTCQEIYWIRIQDHRGNVVQDYKLEAEAVWEKGEEEYMQYLYPKDREKWQQFIDNINAHIDVLNQQLLELYAQSGFVAAPQYSHPQVPKWLMGASNPRCGDAERRLPALYIKGVIC